MKIFIFFTIGLVFSFPLNAQEFCNNIAFTSGLKKYMADSAKNFNSVKGKYKYEISKSYTNYEGNLKMPFTDSVVISQDNYGMYNSLNIFFPPTKSLVEIKKTERKLIECLVDIIPYTIYTQYMNDTISSSVFYHNYLFNIAKPGSFSERFMETLIEKRKTDYILRFVVWTKGKNLTPKPIAPPQMEEPELNSKIQKAVDDIGNYFNSFKTTYFKEEYGQAKYNTTQSLFGEQCYIYEILKRVTFTLHLDKSIITSPERAKAVYNRLLSAVKATGKFVFKPDELVDSEIRSYGNQPGQNSLRSAGITCSFAPYNLFVHFSISAYKK